MSTTDRTPVVLAMLDDLVRERVESRAAHGGCTDADLLHLSDGLALAVDHVAVAALWLPTEVDVSDAEYVLDMLLNDVTFGAKNERPMLVAVARRLADVAASMLVRGDAHRHEAAALWDAASRLLGLDAKASGPAVPTYNTRLADAMAEVMQLQADIGSLREQVAELTRQRDEARRERDEAQADIRKILGLRTGSPVSSLDPDKLRSTAVGAGACECTLFVDSDTITLAISDTRHGTSPRQVANRVFENIHVDERRTVVVRTTGPADTRREFRSTHDGAGGRIFSEKR